MKLKSSLQLALASVCVAVSFGANAGGGHYVPGVEGTDSAAVPPKGDYYIGYLVNYSADTFKVNTPNGAINLPGANKVTVNALANRFVRITDTKILGADYGMEVIVPVLDVKADLTGAGAGNHSDSGIGDVYVGPLVLGWHGSNWHTVAAAGMWLDNGKYDNTNAASVGNGYKSTMLTGGVTYTLDDAKEWSASLLSRYEINTRQKDSNLKFGDMLTTEWGVSKAFGAQKVGLVGYLQKQMGTDSGTGASTQKAGKSAVGFDFTTPVPALGGLVRAAFYQESGAKAASAPEAQGRTLRLTFVKPL